MLTDFEFQLIIKDRRIEWMASDNLATKLGIATYIGNGNGRSVNDIATHFGISVRTVYRFLDRLQLEGYPLTNEERRNGKEKLWTMVDAHSDRYGNAIPSSEFTQEERILLRYILAELKKSEDMLPSFKTIRHKLTSILSQKAEAFPSLDYAQGLSRKLYPIENVSSISKMTSKKTQHIVKDIFKAIGEKKRICITYHVPNKLNALEEDDLTPVFSFFFDGGMYLQALRDDGSLRTYAIERIGSVSIVEDSTALIPDFDPGILLTDPFGPFIGTQRIDAKIWIAPAQVQYVKERSWPDSVRIMDEEDGSAIFETTTYGEREFVDWIFSMRANARLLEPEWLKARISSILDEMASLYHTSF